MTNKALAEALGLAPSTTLVRRRQLEQAGVLRGYHAEVDPAALGMGLQALITVRLRQHTEPDVASSDATNIQGSIRRDGDEYVINARKWWTSGAGDPRCKILIFMGKTDPDAPPHKQQSMVLVPVDTSGVHVLRHLNVFGYDDAPHGHMEIDFDDVRVPVENILRGEGR